MEHSRYASSADMYPPFGHSSSGSSSNSHPVYDPVSYSANASRDYLGDLSHSQMNPGMDSPRLGGNNNDSTAFLAGGASSHYGEKYSDSEVGGPPESMLQNHPGRKRGAAAGGGRRKRWFIIGGVALLVVIIAAIAGGVAAARKSSNDPSSSASSSSASENDKDKSKDSPKQTFQNSALIGGNNTQVTMENGSNFTYVNNFGGYWVSTPFDDSARPQSWTKALNESWDFQNDKIFGVNIGGWLVTEPFIVPYLYEPFENDTQPAVDEYTLMASLGANATAALTEHYDTFITEQDFAEIAGAGLSWVRISIPHWAIETVEGEPFLEGVSWKYFLKAVGWARKYGLRINMDLHTMPGSQNGWNHSGRLGSIGFLNGTNGVFNAQRGLNYIRTLAEFISQPEYQNVIPMFSIINEPNLGVIGNETLREFYLEAYDLIRSITGSGQGNGAWISFHDGFAGLPSWSGFLSGSDRVAMDQHNYLAFSTPDDDSIGYQAGKPCSYWSVNYNNSMNNFGFSYSGEWSLAINDCGVYLNNVGNGARYDGTYIAPGSTTPTYQAKGSCSTWNDWQNWDDSRKQGMKEVALASMDATQNWFFWTWKIGRSVKNNLPPNPMWNMQLGLAQGYFPLDPRAHFGTCATVIPQQGYPALATTATFTAFPSPWMTGGTGANTVAADQVSSYSVWPPTSINIIGTQATNLLTYTPTGTPITLSAGTPTSLPAGATVTVKQGDGWAKAADTAPAQTPIAGCTYPAPYDGVTLPVPTAACTGA